MKNYDVAVVGAGPVGSTLARYIAEKGHSVALIERKKEVGVPLQCAGLLGKMIKEVNLLPSKFIINEVKGAFLHSPSDITLKVAKSDPEAYVLDRVAYDQFLTEKAVDNGADLYLGNRVTDLNVFSGIVKLNNDQKLSAKVIVGSDGYQSIVASRFNPPTPTFQAVQYLVRTDNFSFDTNYVDLFVNSKISPGFLWIIPLSESLVRVGLFSSGTYPEMNLYLDNFLQQNPKFPNYNVEKKYFGHIPLYDSKKQVVHERCILLGDAASQVKPTTGGGLILGFRAASIASDVVTNALENNDISLLSEYRLLCQDNFKKELKTQLRVQKIFQSLNNSDLDLMFVKLKELGAEELISSYGNMDTQTPLVKQMIKRGIIFSVLPKLLSRKVASLWK